MRRIVQRTASSLLSRNNASIGTTLRRATVVPTKSDVPHYDISSAPPSSMATTMKRTVTSTVTTGESSTRNNPFTKLARHPPAVHRAIESIAQVLSSESHAQPELWKDLGSWPASSYQNQSRMVLYNRTQPRGVGDVPEFVNTALKVVMNSRIEERGVQRQGFRVLVLVPTREHALVAERQFNNMLKEIRTQTDIMRSRGVDEHDLYELDDVEVLSTIGGHSYEREVQTMDFNEPEIVIATPGRLTKHLKNSDYFRNLKIFVMDQCEALFEPITKDSLASSFKKNHFKAQLEDICSNLSAERMTVCVSRGKVLKAEDVPLSILVKTMESKQTSDEKKEEEEGAQEKSVDSNILHIVKSHANYVKKPVKKSLVVCADDTATLDALAKHLKANLHRKSIVFTQNASVSREIAEEMKKRDVYCSHIDHKIAQTIREAVFTDFNESKNGVLVCTETFARMLEPVLDLVIHTQLSTDGKLTTDDVGQREMCTFSNENATSQLFATGENPLPETFTESS